MPRPWRLRYAGAKYHLTVRGNGREAVFRKHHGHRLGERKALAVEWCCRISGASQRAVGQYLGYGSESAVGKARKRAQAALSKSRAFAVMERKVLKLTAAMIDRKRKDA